MCSSPVCSSPEFLGNASSLEGNAPMAVQRAARVTAATSVPACTCIADGTTSTATLLATDSHAVLMLRSQK